jgi:sulfate adenylyltransferase subunit 2
MTSSAKDLLGQPPKPDELSNVEAAVWPDVRPQAIAHSPTILPEERPPRLNELEWLESESIHIIREVAATFRMPVMLFSGGKDSAVMLHLAAKAFWPGPIPFGLLHVDTGHNFEEVIQFRDAAVDRYGVKLAITSVQDYLNQGQLRERADGLRNPLQTVPLLDAIAAGRHDAVFGGGRRDEDRARAKERIYSLRDAFGQWDPRNQRPELWSLYNGRHLPGEHVRVFPLSNWTELDIWYYIAREEIGLPAIYYAHRRPVITRDGMWIAVTPVTPPGESDNVEIRSVRYRTVGDMTCTAATLSQANTVADIILEIASSQMSERGATRADDRLTEAGMEDRKREGYF